MKKAMVLIVLFAILAITFTCTMINIKKIDMLQSTNDSQDNPTSNFISNQTANASSKIKRNTKAGIYGTYDQNDCWKESRQTSAYGYNIEIPQVNGLKDKSVQEKINNNIEMAVKEDLYRIINDIGGTPIVVRPSNAEHIYDLDYDENKIYPLGFSNIISAVCIIEYEKDGQKRNYDTHLNYELVNGNRLSFYDIFEDDTDVKPILASLLHGVNAASECWRVWDSFYDAEEYYGESRFDSENDVWVYEHYVKKENDYDGYYVADKELDYVPTYTDYEISKMVNKFLKYTPYNFSIGSYTYSVDFNSEDSYKDSYSDYCKYIADDLVIYDKYLTQESLFERDDIGKKGLLRYACIDLYPVFELDNFIYQVSYIDYDEINTETGGLIPDELLRELVDLYNKKIDDAIDEYREKAKEKKQAFYLYCAPYLKIVEHDHAWWNVVECMPNLEVFSCDYDDKEVLYDTIFGNLAYYNIRMYGRLEKGKNFAQYVQELSYGSRYRFEDETYQDYINGQLEYVTEKGITIKYDILEETNSVLINLDTKKKYEATAEDYDEYKDIKYDSILNKLDANIEKSFY